jgi:short-subunit dehydrogenase
MDLKEKYGPWCMVAGAAEGLGRSFTEILAKQGMGVIIVDYQKEALDGLGKDLVRRHGIDVRTVCLDLATPESVTMLMNAIKETGCRLLIYNAAFSRVKPFADTVAEELDRYIQVNMGTPLKLIHAFVMKYRTEPSLKKGIILMSSLAGSWGSSLLGPYGSTKAFTQILAESLHQELKAEGFHVLVSITGATATPGYLSSLPKDRDPPGGVMLPDKVAEECLNALGKKIFHIPGTKNRLLYFLLTRILPRSSSVRIMNREVRKLYLDRSREKKEPVRFNGP